jgi:peptidoglycan/LPS O-acetylase OafA/YrhL
LKELDILRGVAVLLVLACHCRASEFLLRSGWVGVDLFFVLSGFLVSGLLFVEYQRAGRIRIGRFFARRGLKIYPAFYFFIGLTLLFNALHSKSPEISNLMRELAFIQNYGPGIWPHTWSLAVEEHFYLLVGLGLFISTRLLRRPFRFLPIALLAVCAMALVLRLIAATIIPVWDITTQGEPTHMRLDSLAFGVLVSYAYHFCRDELERLIVRYQVPLFLLALLCIFTVMARLQQDWFVHTIGYTLLYIGFGSLLLWALFVKLRYPGWLARVGTVVSTVGFYSYSIYLWHLAARYWLLPGLYRFTGVRENSAADLGVYILVACGTGILMARLVEVPSLKFRDKLFPSTRSVEKTSHPIDSLFTEVEITRA